MTANEKIIKDLRLSKERFLHTMGVADCAKKLARRHFPSLSAEKTETAALLHDFTKEYSLNEQIALCRKYNIALTDEEKKTPKLYHAKTAAAIAKHQYGVDEETASAIYYHTTGRANMTVAEVCLYFADYIEEYRTEESCVKVREYYESLLFKEQSHLTALYKAVVYSFNMTILHLLEISESINTETVNARNWYINILKEGKETNGGQ